VTEIDKKPLYKTVKLRLQQQIKSGQLVSGQLLPSEMQMAEDFGCARLTVHRAVRELAQEGYVERRRRAGTRVAKRGSQGVQLAVPRVDAEVFALGAVYRYELLNRRIVPPPEVIVARLETATDEPLINILCRHWAGERVFQYEDRWINSKAVPSALLQSFRLYGPNHWLLDNVPFSDVEHRISAVAADKEASGALQVDRGTPLLQIRRRTTSQNRRITCVTLLYPGDLHQLESGPQPG
jgi:GntR family transcriptional regulator, histidine utilization repressor